MWYDIASPFPNFNGCIVEVWEWIINFILFYNIFNYTSILGSTLIHVSKGGRGVVRKQTQHGLRTITCNALHWIICTHMWFRWQRSVTVSRRPWGIINVYIWCHVLHKSCVRHNADRQTVTKPAMNYTPYLRQSHNMGVQTPSSLCIIYESFTRSLLFRSPGEMLRRTNAFSWPISTKPDNVLPLDLTKSRKQNAICIEKG